MAEIEGRERTPPSLAADRGDHLHAGRQGQSWPSLTRLALLAVAALAVAGSLVLLLSV